MTRAIRIGTSEIPAGVMRARYLDKLDYLELARTVDRATKMAPLRKRRREAPDGFGFGVVAQRVLGSAAADDVDAEVGRIAEAVESIEAEVVVFRSPSDFAPSQASRDQLAAFFAGPASADRFAGVTRVWEPQGLWQPRAMMRVAEELELVLACDPLALDPTDEDHAWPYQLPGGAAYLRIRGLGASASLRPDQLDEIRLIAETYERAWIVVDTADAFRDAVNLARSMA